MGALPAISPTNLRQGTGTDTGIGVGGASNGQTLMPSLLPTGGANPGQAPIANPYTPPGVTVPSGGVPGTNQGSPVTWGTGDHSVVGDFQASYGKGTGTAITQVLQNLGTSTDSAVQATTNAVDQAANQQYANIRATQAASGITPDSSAAALASGDFFSNVNTNLQSTIANMENNQESTLLSALMNEGEAHGGDQSTFQSIMNMIPGLSSIIGSGANIANTLPGIGTGAASSFLDAVGALA